MPRVCGAGMITRHFGVPSRGLVSADEVYARQPPSAGKRLKQLWARLLKGRGAGLSPVERRKLFKVIDGGKDDPA